MKALVYHLRALEKIGSHTTELGQSAHLSTLQENGLNRQEAEALTQHLTSLILYQTQFTKDNFVTKEQLHRLDIQVQLSLSLPGTMYL